MGRTGRRRKRRVPLGNGPDLPFIEFTKWMLANRWSPLCKMAPSWLAGSGRGLVALEPIAAGRTIVTIPVQLLVTLNTVSKTDIGRLLSRSEISFSTQQVLAAFLVLERHLGHDSFWEPYIRLLPTEFDSPLFCSEEELKAFPNFIQKIVDSMRIKLETLYEELFKVLGENVCRHCDKRYRDFYGKEEFTWAWFVVNSRAVYFSPSHNPSHDIKISDENSLALAPYLDFINHSNEARVQAYLVEDKGSYCLRTLVPYNKYEQVFIHYGSHSNLKLFLEYGFVLPKNRHDTVPLDLQDILAAISSVLEQNVECPSAKYKLLQAHDMLSGLYCNSEGLSWNARVVIFVLLCSDTSDPKSVYRKIFSDDFSPSEMKDIASVGKELANAKQDGVSKKLTALENYLNSRPGCPRKNTLLLGVEHVKILSAVLDNCKVSLDNYCRT